MLGPIQCVVSHLHDGARRQAGARRDRSDRGRDPRGEPRAAQEPVAADLPVQPSRHRRRTGAAGGRQENRELVAADPRDEIGPSRTRAQQRRRLYQHPVAPRMTITIVHGLEIIQIDQQQRNRTAAACPQRERGADGPSKKAAVRQAGQVVGQGERLRPFEAPGSFQRDRAQSERRAGDECGVGRGLRRPHHGDDLLRPARVSPRTGEVCQGRHGELCENRFS